MENRNIILIALFLFFGWNSFGQNKSMYTIKSPKPCDIFTPNLVVDNTTLVGSLDYRVINSIKVAPNFNVTVLGSSNVEMRAGSEILLYPGFSVQSGGKYFAEITPCTKMRSVVKQTKIVENELVFYPNPIQDKLTVQIKNFEKGTDYTLKIYNVQGLQQLELDTQTEKTEVNLSAFPPGIYIVKVSNGITTYNAKLIKK